LIKAVYGADALSRLNEEEDDDDELDAGGEKDLSSLDTVCSLQVKSVSLIELDELIIGALNSVTFERAQNGTYLREKTIRRRCTYCFFFWYNQIMMAWCD
jgi:peroxin-6